VKTRPYSVQVMVSFLATAALTIIAVLLAYFQDCLPEDLQQNGIDQLVRTVASRFVPRSWYRAVAIHDDVSESPREMDKKTKKSKRREGYQDFILVLSDQQLVTGLAILVAGFMICDISLYSFTIVSAVAWFSSTTHLSSLAVLKGYVGPGPVSCYLMFQY
jgi:hypothetical protein